MMSRCTADSIGRVTGSASIALMSSGTGPCTFHSVLGSQPSQKHSHLLIPTGYSKTAPIKHETLQESLDAVTENTLSVWFDNAVAAYLATSKEMP